MVFANIDGFLDCSIHDCICGDVMNMEIVEKFVEYLAGIAILCGIIVLLLSAIVHELSSIGWILIIFGAIWAVLDMTLFRKAIQ